MAQQQKYHTDEERRLARRATETRYKARHKDDIKKQQKLYWENNKEKNKEQSKKWAAANPEKIKNNMLKFSYGIGIEDYNQMFEIQGGCCAICGKHQSEFKKALCVDHNHETGQVRGLLCNACNSMLGYAFDNKIILGNAIKYLK
jgi:hypothetical protein